ncbi:DNA-directed RNA polymerase sigma-70 factor [Steroidobacter agaridevorans]|uniref:DNA-directed RNA polymerase sigma-70 factor n=1 Tax=Steroidobacter agaridevorans TaxID=2695856 RepID=A0A829Y8N6_9GAMM|nr:ECF-type sigma factor [Steroidobacter agaridevorans]GFE79667.1 DNA-directed RNA polymerase sigma-70 factor [Steroidobacter agaridevorans]
MPNSALGVTQLLAHWRGGDAAALPQLMTLLYQELRSMAHDHVRRERRDHTLQGTALVNEAFVRLINLESVSVKDRAHFFAVASTVMRRILVDYARARLSAKRGGEAQRISSDALEDANAHRPHEDAQPSSVDDDVPLIDMRASEEISALDNLLSRLATLDERQAQVVEMRYFGGLTVEQTAQALAISEATVKREWVAARAWLRRELARTEQ